MTHSYNSVLTNRNEPAFTPSQDIKAFPRADSQTDSPTSSRQEASLFYPEQVDTGDTLVLIILQGTICGYTIENRHLDMYNNCEVSGAATSQSDANSRYTVADILSRLSNGEAVTPSVSTFFVHGILVFH